MSVLPAVPPIYDEMISWQLLCPQGCLPQLPQEQNENLGTKTRTEVKAVSAYSKRGPWGLQELRLSCWAGSCVKGAAKAMLCVTPDPGTCRKPVLLPHFSKVALTCDLGDFYCLDWGVGAIYSCLLRSYSLLGQVCPLLMSVLTSRASNFLACLPQLSPAGAKRVLTHGGGPGAASGAAGHKWGRLGNTPGKPGLSAVLGEPAAPTRGVPVCHHGQEQGDIQTCQTLTEMPQPSDCVMDGGSTVPDLSTGPRD